MFKCVPARRRILTPHPRRQSLQGHALGCVLTISVALSASMPVHAGEAKVVANETVANETVAITASLGSGKASLRGTKDHSADLITVAKQLSRTTAAFAKDVGTGGDAAGGADETLVTGAINPMPEDDFSSWFRYGSEVEADWRVGGVAGEPNTVRIRPRKAFDPTSEGRRPRIFVLYPRRSSAYDVSITQILSVLAQKGIRAEITVMNFQRDPKAAQAALDQARRNNSDLIFAMGSESTAWLWGNFRDGDIPVVSVCSKDPVMLGQAENYDEGTGTNFAFTSLNMTVEAQLAYVMGLKPNLKNLAVLVDRNNVSAVQTQSRPIALAARKRGVRVVELELVDRTRAKVELATLVSDAVKSMKLNDPSLDNSLFWITGSTAVFREIATINEHSNRVPVLSVVPEVVKPGDDSAALSVGISFKSNAHLAALYGVKVLDGTARVGSLKVGVPSPPDIAINFKRVREIGLRMPFSLFEAASTVIDYEGKAVRLLGKSVAGG